MDGLDEAARLGREALPLLERMRDLLGEAWRQAQAEGRYEAGPLSELHAMASYRAGGLACGTEDLERMVRQGAQGQQAAGQARGAA